MLDANLTQQLKAYLVNIRQPIELVASLGDDAKSRQMRELIDEIAALSDKITVAAADATLAVGRYWWSLQWNDGSTDLALCSGPFVVKDWTL